MIRLLIEPASEGRPKVRVVHHATGADLAYPTVFLRTRKTGRWGLFTSYYTPEDRQHLLNEARAFAEGYAEGYRLAVANLSRVADDPIDVSYKADDVHAVNFHNEALRRNQNG